MLVLTRREGEKMIIAGEIEITVCQIGAGRVKIGVKAPPHVHIYRAELRDCQPIIHQHRSEAATRAN